MLHSCQCKLILTQTMICLFIHCVSKKDPTFKLSVTLSNLNRFSKFLQGMLYVSVGDVVPADDFVSAGTHVTLAPWSDK